MMGEQAQWLKNTRANPEVALRLHDGTFRGVAHEAAIGAEREWALDNYVGTIVPNDYVAYAVYCWGVPTRRKIKAAHEEWFASGVPVIIDVATGP